MLVNDDRARRRLLLATAANIGCLLLLLAFVLSMSFPPSEATRLRNALVLQVAAAQDLQWTPEAIPASFRVEHLAPSASYQKIVDELGIHQLPNDWDKAVRLADHLTRHARDRGPIQAGLDETYVGIVRDGRGYCADFTEVYLGLVYAAGLFAREWAFSSDGFGGKGHAFIEVYDNQRKRWLFIDVYNNVHAVHAETREPVSATEFRDFVLGAGPALDVQRNGPGRLGYKYTDKLLEFYRSGASQWYLWGGNAVFTYDAHPLVRIAGLAGPAAEQAVAIVAGVHPHILAPRTEVNGEQIDRMLQLRIVLIGVFCAGLLLGVVLVVQVVYLVRGSGRIRAREPLLN